MGEKKIDEFDRGKSDKPPTPERPPAELHDPFGQFDFEPTDGGEF